MPKREGEVSMMGLKTVVSAAVAAAMTAGIASCGSGSNGGGSPGAGGSVHGGGVDGGGGTAGTGGATNTGNGGATARDGATDDAGATGCDDKLSCTIDYLVNSVCTHSVGPNSGATACPAGQYCTTKDGCVSPPACATSADCEKTWAADACKTHIACDAASSVCTFDALDKDGDGHAPAVCGGGDCDDADSSRYPGAPETCDGKDNDCNGAVDDGATCTNSLEVCQAGACACPPANACGTACVDTQSDAKNCGTCANFCPSGKTCQKGTCVCDPSVCGTVIGSSSAPQYVAVDDTHVYWTDGDAYTDGSGSVHRVAKDGSGKTETLSSGTAETGQILVDANYVYYMVDNTFDSNGAVPNLDGSLNRMAKAGGTPTSLASGFLAGGPAQMWLTGSEVLFVSPDLSSSSLARVPLGGGATTPIASNLDLIEGVASDGTNVFWSTDGINGGPTYIHSRPLAGGSDVVIFTGDIRSNAPTLLAVDGSNLYWSDDYSFEIDMAPKGGGAVTTLVSGKKNTRVKGLALDDSYIYWTGLGGYVSRVSKTGGSVEPIVSGDPAPLGIAVDAGYIYWADPYDKTVRRIAKP